MTVENRSIQVYTLSVYEFLDDLFVVVHSALVAFALVGWIWNASRKLHLVVMSPTMGCWFILGLKYGFGYCPCTDWHWQVKRQLGETSLPGSYIQYYLGSLTGIEADPTWIDRLVGATGIGLFGLSLFLHRRQDTMEPASPP